MGGATVVGATMVVSSPAFAYDAPTITPSGSLSIVPLGTPGIFQIDVVQYPTATCPSSATLTPGLPNAPIVERTVTATSIAIETGFVWRATQGLVGAGANVIMDPTAANTETYIPPSGPATGDIGEVRKRTAVAPSAPGAVVSGDSFRVDVEVVFQCTYSDNTTRSGSSTFSATFLAP
jgi:hypothetical protein